MIQVLKILAISYVGMLLTFLFAGFITKDFFNGYFYTVVLATINRFWLMFLSIAASYFFFRIYVGTVKLQHVIAMGGLSYFLLILLLMTYVHKFRTENLFPDGLWYLGYTVVTFSIYLLALKYKFI